MVKKWLAAAFISCYLGALTFGIFSHTFQHMTSSHPAMYFIVWDMFCGWNAHSSHMHVIAEGESGDYYRLTPAPWGAFVPFGTKQRRHYDTHNRFTGKIGANILQHTAHEPMLRMLVVEESWPKKFNIPDHLWEKTYNEPKDVYRYHRTIVELTPDGEEIGRQKSWIDSQVDRIMTENPRLRQDSVKGASPYILSSPSPQQVGSFSSGSSPTSLAPNAQ